MNSIFSPSSPDSSDCGPFISADDYSIVIAPQLFDLPMKLSNSPPSGPYLRIIEQPVDKFRFRYKSEMMGTHGSILAKDSLKNRRRVYPTVMLQNYEGEAIIRCSIYTAHPNESMRTPHTHRLVVRDGNNDKDDPHEVKVSADNNYTAVFKGMGIIHTARKHIADELTRKNRALKLERLQQRNANASALSIKEETEIKAEAEFEAKRMNLNSVTLCFEALEEGPDGVKKKLCEPVFSTPINNMKSALTGELKICRIDKKTSCCSGGEEVFILVEKVGRKNIKIKFFEIDDDDNEVWCDFGKFSELDVHHQYAIVFRTPPYKDTEITEKVDVFLQLYRPTDGDCSEPIRFTYRPSEKLGRKRQRMSFNENFSKYLNQDNVLANDLVKLGSSGTSANNSIDKISTSLNDVRIESKEFEEFMKIFSSSGNIADYLDSLPQGPQSYSRLEYYLTTDSEKNSHKQANGKMSDSPVPGNSRDAKSVNQKEIVEESTLARRIMDEVKRNASLKRPVFTERIFKMLMYKSEDGNSALHAAVIHGQKLLLKDMLDVICREPKNSLINCINNKEQTPLHIAAADQPVLVRLLLRAGADPNRQDADGNTPLHLASKYNSKKCVDELLSQSNYPANTKVDLNKKNSSGWTPLHLSVIHKNHEVVKKLVAAGANVNEGDTSGRTVLHLAAEENDDIITSFLIENTNIDMNKQDLCGYTALDRARAAVGKKHPSQLCNLLGDTKVVTAQMETTEFDFTKIKLEPVDTDDELHIDEDEDEEDDEEDDDDDEDEDEEDEDDIDDETENTNKDEERDVQKSIQSEEERKQILSLLNIVGHSPEREINSPELPEIKQEMLASPVSEITDEISLFSPDVLTQLCDILDASGSWADLADLLGYNFIIPNIKDASSPSKLLFYYADADNVTVQEIRNFLSLLDEDKAVELVDSVTNKDS